MVLYSLPGVYDAKEICRCSGSKLLPNRSTAVVTAAGHGIAGLQSKVLYSLPKLDGAKHTPLERPRQGQHSAAFVDSQSLWS